MKLKKALSTLLISTLVFGPVISVSAKEIFEQDYQAEAIREMIDTANFDSLEKSDGNIDVSSMRNAINFVDDLGSIQGELMEEAVGEKLQIIENEHDAEHNSSENNGGTIGIAPMLSNNYFWNYNTAVFEPSRMVATNDIDIVWNRYQGNGGEDDYQPMGYPSLSAATYYSSTLQSDYDRYVNQGHVNDYLGGAVYGSHTYYTVLSGNCDTITAFASSKVRVRIADMSNMSLVFDSGYGTSGESYSPAAGGNISYYSTANTTSFGASKRVYHIRFNTSVGGRVYCVILSPYTPYYPTTWDQIDNLDPTYHYAFYSGYPLPGRLTMSNISAHNAVVQYSYNTRYLSSFESDTTATTLSVSTPSAQNNLYALRSITVKEYSSSQNNFYLSSLYYKFKWPGGTSFYYLTGSSGTYTYTFNTGLSPIGTWQFMYNGSWIDSTNTFNYFLGLTTMSMEYLAPYGYIAKY